jgi:hypothetical protein
MKSLLQHYLLAAFGAGVVPSSQKEKGKYENARI